MDPAKRASRPPPSASGRGAAPSIAGSTPAAPSEVRELGEISVKDVIRAAVPLAGRRVVDLGCGNGALAAWLARQGAKVVAIDPDGALLTDARNRDAGLEPIAATAERLPLAAGSVDALIFFNSLHHVAPDRQVTALAEAARVLRPAGDLLVVEPEAAGSYFALLQPIDDETAVRRAAMGAIRAVAGRLCIPLAAGRFLTALAFADASAVLDALVRADAGRAAAARQLRPLIERRFVAAGELLPDGRRRFVQPMRFWHLQNSL